ncbi:LysR family transcriptional regulator [Klebsiella oxytoca]|uniref:LysR family transcriptional regulator n=1 Tax=Klebsiella oxytoca TaxID=571 RepID=A0A6B8MQ54_KLEOX|nr:LysR family transcriptional regulator [Klebsiella oxytoca]QGN36494.1 LysR family transcriptional regulator [Klebsiella oxytoca]
MGSKGANKDFDYNLIKTLDAVVSAGNAAKAARKLGITPAAVSLALRRLQGYYQEELFIRGRDGLLPTARAIEIHQNFRQVMELINSTFVAENKANDDARMTILGGDIVEAYYLSQLYSGDIFDRVLLNHYSSRNLTREMMAELLLTAECDVLISSEPLNMPGIDNQLIDSFKSFVCIFASNHILSTLPDISLHHFYSSRHAMYQPGMYSPMIINERGLFKDELYYKGSRIIGYRSDSLNGIMSMIERTSLIALMPLKLALFYKNQRKYDVKFVQPPPELTFKSIQVYASWDRNSKNLPVINEVVSLLHTLSSFRR